MRRIAIVILLWLAAGLNAAWAQTYAYRSTTFSWDAVTGAATAVTWDPYGGNYCSHYPNSPVSGRPGDDVAATVNFPGGFTFPFAGTSYNAVRVLSNGMLQFGADAGFHRDYSVQQLPVTAAAGFPGGGTLAGCANAVPSNLMLVYWRDIDTARSASSAVYTELKGTAPNRRFVITWNNVYLYNTSTFYNFQAILNEDGTFVYQYTAGGSDGSGADVGVQVGTTDYTEYSYNQTFIDPTNGTAILWYLSSVAPAQIGEYRLDEWSWNGTAGEVLDSSGTARHGVRAGNAQTITQALGGGSYQIAKVCGGGRVPSNTTANTVDAIDISQNPGSQIGPAGSVTFWYRSNDAWTAGVNHVLFDAGTAAAAPFFFAKMRSGGNDVLRFSLTDSAGTVRTVDTGDQNFAAGIWVHVGVSWYLAPGTNRSVLQIFVNGARAAFLRTTTTGALAAGLASLYAGDNRIAGVTPANGSGNSGSGDFDEIRVYSFDIAAAQAVRDMNVTRANCSPLHHFHISHSGSGLTCQPENVVISAHDSSHNLVTLVGTTITLSTSTNHGNWSRVTGNGTLINNGNGAGSYIFSAESQVTLGLADTIAETLNINVDAGGITENTGSFANHDPNLSFANTGFKVVGSSLVEATIGTKIAGKDSEVAPEGQIVYLQALKTDMSNYACTALFPNSPTPVPVGMAFECLNPATCQAVNASITNSAGTATANIALNPASYAGYSSVPLVFGANAMARFRFNYPDAGQIRVLAAKDIGAGNYINGASQPFVVRPYDFVLGGVAATVAASRPAGGLVRAGEAFTATVTATNLLGNATRNFGCENPAEGLTLTPTVTAPAGGNNGSLYRGAATPATIVGASLCGSGTASVTDLAWSEVGTMTLTGSVADGNYLGAGPVAGSASAGLGRFYPDHFSLSGTVTVPCGFTYMDGASIDITAGRLEARTMAGGHPNDQPVTNYRAGYPVALASVAFVAADLDGVDRSARFAPAPTLAGWTTGAHTLSGTGLVFTRSPTPDGPYDNFNVGLRVTDGSDNAPVLGGGPAMAVAGCSTASAASYCTARAVSAGSPIKVRYGRLRLANAIGSAKLPLAMPIEAQYRTAGGGWVTNTMDSCTQIPLNRVLQGNAQKGLPVLSFVAAPNPIPLAAGRAALRINAPNHEGSRDLVIDLAPAGATSNCVGVTGSTPSATDLTHLRDAWCAGGTRDPAGRASFDVYRQDQKFIYMRENY